MNRNLSRREVLLFRWLFPFDDLIVIHKDCRTGIYVHMQYPSEVFIKALKIK
jgi:hypothetical protein